MPPPNKASPSCLNPDGSLLTDLGLTPQELMLPAWRAEFGLALPPAAEFDSAAAMKRLGKCCYPNRYIHSPENAGIPVSMTREEAWFWLRAMTNGFFKTSQFESKNAFKAPSTGEVLRLLNRGITTDGNNPGMSSVMSNSWYPELACAVRTLLSTEEILDFILGNITAFETSGLSQFNIGFGNLLAGCCMFVTPYLTAAECERHAQKHHAVLLADPDLTQPQGIAALAILAVLGQAEAVTQTLYQTKGKFYHASSWLFARTKSPDDFIALRQKHGQRSGATPWFARLLLATLGLSRSDELYQCLSAGKPEQTRVMKVFRRVRHPEIAPLMLELCSRLKDAGAWLRENALLAAVGLAPHAVGAGKHAPAAMAFWKDLWLKDENTAREALAHLPAPVASLLEGLDTTSPNANAPASAVLPEELKQALDRVPAKSMPAWLSTALLPGPRVEGRMFEHAQTSALVSAFKSGKEQPLVRLVKEHCEAASLSDLAEALFRQWRQGAYPPTDMWVLSALGWLGSDDAHLRLARYLPYRPMDSPWPHTRACAGVRALAAAGTPVALNQIYRLAHATYESMQKTESLQCLSKAAQDAGMSAEELMDACVPDAGFNAAGVRRFVAPGATVEARLTPHLELRFVWPDGSERQRLPPAARLLPPPEFQRLCMECRRVRRLLRDTADIQVMRFRAAIAQDFKRPADVFRSRVLGHPLLLRLARQMVWQFVSEEMAEFTFRPAEDGTLIDARGDMVTLPPGGMVHLASSACMPEAETTAWMEHLSDHAIIQPIKQFAGLACLPLPGERDLVRVNRFAGSPTTGGQLKQAFAAEHWSHDKPQEGGDFTRHFRAFPGAGLFACVRHSRVWTGNANWGGQNADERPAEIEDVWFLPDSLPKKEWRNSKHYFRMHEVPAAVFSEVFSLLHRMTGVPIPRA
jgi:hypothetical protein